MDVKVTWRIEVLSAVDKSRDVNGQITKVTWRIENFSNIKDKLIKSENFIVDGIKWWILFFPKGYNVDNYSSIFLHEINSATLPVQFGFAVIDQIDRKTSFMTEVTSHEFKEKETVWGFQKFLALGELHDPKRGYLVNDTCLLEAYVSTDRTGGLISRELMIDADTDKDKIKKADCAEAIDREVPNEGVSNEPKEPTEEDMKTFFTSLESELSSSNIVYSQEEAKEALTKLDEALNMAPVNFYNSVKFSPLKKAFKVLDCFDCTSITLTIEQRNELLSMEERLEELACRAAKAVQDKNLLGAKKSVKLTVTRNLDCSLIRFKQLERKLAALHEQVEEAQKNSRHNLLAEQKEIFKSCRKMKMELETLGKEWAEYEANAKVAEEDEKKVEVEWRRMKDFISSIKEKI